MICLCNSGRNIAPVVEANANHPELSSGNPHCTKEYKNHGTAFDWLMVHVPGDVSISQRMSTTKAFQQLDVGSTTLGQICIQYSRTHE